MALLLPQPRQVQLGETPRAPLNVPVRALILPGTLPAQGYRIVLSAHHIDITAADDAGLFYARQTLRQLARQNPAGYPTGLIEDWPDFPVRGVMLDISRDKVPRMETLFLLADELASWKINRLELYTEHTFAYARHRDVWAMASPMTAQEIQQLDAYCRERFIELVPNQNSFGHFERWLALPRYRHLAECPHGYDSPSGRRPPGTLDPTNPQAIALLRELYDELLPNFSSRNINVGCDETFELGLGNSASVCAARGKGRVYLDFLRNIYELTQRHGRRMHFWGDIIVEHPELIAELPRDVVPLAWWYEASPSILEKAAAFARSGLSFFVCPGTSSWLTILGRTTNCLANLDDAACVGRELGATGFLITDWGDCGHWQQLPVSYLGLAAGAALSWCYQANRNQPWPEILNRHVFQDEAGVLGPLAVELGDAYLQTGVTLLNSTVFHHLIAPGPSAIDHLTAEGCARALAYIEDKGRLLSRARPARPDGAWICEEFAQAIRMATFACHVGLNVDPLTLGSELRCILGEQAKLWLRRNRPGGLTDSLRRLERRLEAFDQRALAAAAQPPGA